MDKPIYLWADCEDCYDAPATVLVNSNTLHVCTNCAPKHSAD